MNFIKLFRALILVSCIAITMCGCACIPGGIAASTEPINGRKYLNLGRVSDTDSKVMLFGIIPVSGSNSIRDAVDAALRKRGGDAMIGVTVESYTQFWILFTRRVTLIEGDVIKFQTAN